MLPGKLSMPTIEAHPAVTHFMTHPVTRLVARLVITGQICLGQAQVAQRGCACIRAPEESQGRGNQGTLPHSVVVQLPVLLSGHPIQEQTHPAVSQCMYLYILAQLSLNSP